MTGEDSHSSLNEHRFFDVAPRLLANGYSPLPVEPRSKKTRIRGWSSFGHRLPPPTLHAHWLTKHPDHSTGIVCGRCFAIDIDATDPLLADDLERATLDILGGNPLRRVGKEPKRLLLYQSLAHIRTSRMAGADLLGQGSYFVAFGIHPETSKPYIWTGDSPLDRSLESIPLIKEGSIERLRCAFKSLMKAEPHAGAAAIDLESPASGQLILDGRDSVLRDEVWRAWCAGADDPETIAEEAFGRFTERVDLERPRRNGTRAWSYADALQKANSLIRSGKVRPAGDQSHVAAVEHFRVDSRAGFYAAVAMIAAQGKLPPAAVAVSNLMLSLANGPSGCFASPETLAAKLNLSVHTVKRARRRLRELGLWSNSTSGGGRGYLSFYHPQLRAARAAAIKVAKLGTWNSSEFREEDTYDSLFPESDIDTSVFESLVISRGGVE